MTVDTFEKWAADGRPWKEAQPVADLTRRLRGYGYTVYELGNDAHLRAVPPEDHTPYSATGWPKTSPYPYVHALDIMPPTKAGLPSLAQLGAQLFADKQTGAAAWLKYMNWEPSGPGGPCWHDEWQPNHTRGSSTDRGHIHISIRSDYTTSTAAAGYDPVARIRTGDDDMPLTGAQDTALSIAWEVADALRDGQDVTEARHNPVWLVGQIKALAADVATLKTQLFALSAKDLVDEQEVARQVLAVLTPSGIADAVLAALPPALAAQVVAELGQRLVDKQLGTPPATA
jgi:hypothetical protein